MEGRNVGREKRRVPLGIFLHKSRRKYKLDLYADTKIKKLRINT